MKTLKLSILLIGVVLSSGCKGFWPQRRVLLSDHPEGQPIGVTLASFPAELRAYTILKLVEPGERTALLELAKTIETEKNTFERWKLVDNYNRRLALAIRHVLVPEPPATVVVTQSKFSPTLKVSTSTNAGGELSLVAEQAATNLGKMTLEELKAYFGYLGYIANQNRGGTNDDTFNEFLIKLTGTAPPTQIATNEVKKTKE